MLDKIIIGTANFIKPYGVLSDGSSVPIDQIHQILVNASEKGITVLDTAIGYGDITPLFPDHLLSRFQIITKFSVLEKKEDVLKNFIAQEKIAKFPRFYGALIHDPQNIPLADKQELRDFLNCLRYDYGVQKIGVSIYDMKDMEYFNSIFMPDIIQIPLNPFNQTFNNEHFKSMVRENTIEIHARSLFLQGVLLSETLPEILEPLRPFWLEFQKLAELFPSRLYALLQWAFHFNWISAWVLGVSSIKNLDEVINFKLNHKFNTDIEFQPVNHPLVDPRNWNIQ